MLYDITVREGYRGGRVPWKKRTCHTVMAGYRDSCTMMIDYRKKVLCNTVWAEPLGKCKEMAGYRPKYAVHYRGVFKPR